MATRREELTGYLLDCERTVKELAALMRATVRDTVQDLEHVRKSTGRRFVARAAECTQCGFVFKGRDKMTSPSRCPECRSERTVGPWLSIKPAP